MEVKVIEKKQDILIQEQEITRKERELEATIRKPAEAERYRLEKIAEANKEKIIMEAEAEAESIRLRGEAEASAIQARARAEAETLAKKADAFKQYEQAAKMEMILQKLPQVRIVLHCIERALTNFFFLYFRLLLKLLIHCQRSIRL